MIYLENTSEEPLYLSEGSASGTQYSPRNEDKGSRRPYPEVSVKQDMVQRYRCMFLFRDMDSIVQEWESLRGREQNQ
jgi:hypothetical protein